MSEKNEMIMPKSTNVLSVEYDAKGAYVDVVFHKDGRPTSKYRYEEITKEMWDLIKMQNAAGKSVGSYIRRLKVPYKKLA
jgi:hypothetical protein